MNSFTAMSQYIVKWLVTLMILTAIDVDDFYIIKYQLEASVFLVSCVLTVHPSRSA